MHPDLWTIPGIGFSIPTYGFFAALAIAAAIWIGVRRARTAKQDGATSTTVAIIAVLFGIIGCRLMHAVHYLWDAIRSGSIGAGEVVAMRGGGEILGGVILGAGAAIAYLAIRRKPILLYMDIAVPPMILGMGIGRIGCLMSGCCWGSTCVTETGEKALPWAVRFPYGSPAYMQQVEFGQIDIPVDLLWKLPRVKGEESAPKRQPVPSDAFTHLDIDADAMLIDFAEAAKAYAIARKQDPGSEETAAAESLMEEKRLRMGNRSVAEIVAARHLLELSSKGVVARNWAELGRLAAQQNSRWVHPAQLYDAVALILLFLLLTAIYNRRRRYGMVLAWGMMLYPVNRILQEIIRVDNPRDVGGLTVSQFLSVLIMLGGAALALALLKARPVKSTADETAIAT